MKETEKTDKTNKKEKSCPAQIIDEMKKAGIELEKWEESKEYPKDRNMI